MAGDAFGLSFGKFQRGMTKFAIHGLVLSNKFEFGRIMIKRQCFDINCPPGGVVAIHAVYLKTHAVRR
jgi:hypothetical protein